MNLYLNKQMILSVKANKNIKNIPLLINLYF